MVTEKTTTRYGLIMSEETLTSEQTRYQVKRIIESLLFATNEPLPLAKINEITNTFCPLDSQEVKKLIDILKEEYQLQRRAFHIEEIGGGYLLRSNEEFREYIDLLFRKKRGARLSQAALEVLSIIAYRKPITRAQIEEIRGVDSSGILQTLLDRELIQTSGKLEAPGRPTLYGLTKDFFQHFGLKGHSDLPDFD